MTATLSTLQLLLGSPDANHLSLRPHGRSHPDSDDFWEGNWLKVHVAVQAGAFAGRFEAELRADELERFADQLAALEGASAGTAALESSEGWVTIKLLPARDGGLEGACEVRDDPTTGTGLRFLVAVDAPQRRDLLAALQATVRLFPVVGDPEGEPAGLPFDDGDGEPQPDQG